MAKATKLLQDRLSMLVGLYLEQAEPKSTYLECKTHLDSRKAELEREKGDVMARLEVSALSDEQVAAIEAFCADISIFTLARLVIELLGGLKSTHGVSILPTAKAGGFYHRHDCEV